MPTRFVLTTDSETLSVEVVERESGYRVRLGEEWIDVDARPPAAGPWSLLVGGTAYVADVHEEGGETVVTIGSESWRVRVDEPGRRRAAGGAARGGSQRLVAPMPGKVVAVHVQPGDRVEAGAPLVVLEAMKMENEFRAAAAGVVAEVAVAPGQPVNPGDLLVVVASEAPTSRGLVAKVD